MSLGRIVAIIVVIAGAGFLYLSHYINQQVAEGRSQISTAQQGVDTTKTLFSIVPGTREISKPLTGGVEKKIEAGTREADQYAEYAKWSMIGGIALIVIGAGGFFVARKKT
jgi:hypothetical protein